MWGKERMPTQDVGEKEQKSGEEDAQNLLWLQGK